jgi:hypothetical protein
VAYVGTFKLLREATSTRRIPGCNVTSTTYYHPITLVCNQAFDLNDQSFDEALRLDQPGTYRVVVDERVIVFTIAPAFAPVIAVAIESQQAIAIPVSQSRWWMIPAAWFGLFVGKKYLG